jgi:hypothetical protein
MKHIDPLEDNDLREAYERLARHLTGKTLIILRFAKPAAKNATGEAYQDEHGIYRINIAPGLSVQSAYAVLLEEAAHIRLHVKERMTAPQIAATAAQDARQVNSDPERKRAETEAAQLANQWYNLGEGKIAKRVRLGTDEKTRALWNCEALQNTKWIKGE